MVDAEYREITPQDAATVSGTVAVSSVTSITNDVPIDDSTPIETSRQYYTDFGTVTIPSGVLSPLPKALFFSAAGDVTLKDDGGTTTTITVTASQFIEGIQPTEITAWTGTASKVHWFA